MQAVLFAAGKSTRTFPLTATKPKPLLKAANTSIIENNLTQLKGLIDEAIIIIGYYGMLIKERLGDSFEGIRIRYVEQKKIQGSGDALVTAMDFLNGRFIALNSDDFFSRKDIEKCLSHKSCILSKRVEDISRFGEVIFDNKGMLKEIKEKPPEKREGFANCGLYVMDKSIFSHKIEKSSRGEYEIVDYIKFLNPKVEMVEDYWFPITYPWNILEANEFFVSRIVKKIEGVVEEKSTIKGAVVIGKNTLIRAGSYIEGPVVIGENCVIGPNCYIRAYTSIGNNSRIGNAVEIKNSVIGDNTCIGHLSYVGDSVIGDNVNLGAGTITANLRHDNQNVKSFVKGELIDSGRRKLGAIIGDGVHTGIHTSIYPGRKIWPNKSTLPGEIVKKDIGE